MLHLLITESATTSSWEYEDGPWEGTGATAVCARPPLLVAADF